MRTPTGGSSLSARERAHLIWEGKAPVVPPPGTYRLAEIFAPASPEGAADMSPGLAGRLYHDDNRPVLSRLGFELAGQVRLVYLDPPYLSGRAYAREACLRVSGRSLGRVVEFEDRVDEPTYLESLFHCLLLARALLAPDGSVWLHCDHRQSHHLRCLLDEVLGAEAFRNEVIWSYGSSARGAKAVGRHLPRNHDSLFWYAMPDARYRPLSLERRIPFADARRFGYTPGVDGRPFRTAPRGDYTDASVTRLEEEGRIHRTRGGRLRVKYFASVDGDCLVDRQLLGDVWTDIPDAMHLPAGEATSYPTQKPERLLERVVLASTDPGDLVLDAFAGSGTTLAVARRLGRRWVGVDASRGAIQAARRRLVAQLPNVEMHARQTDGPGARPFSASAFAVYEPSERRGGVDDTAPRARVSVSQPGAGLVVLQIEEYRSPDVAARLGADPDWREALDCVLIDPDYDGEVFRARWADVPGGRLEPVRGRYEIARGVVGGVVAVKLVDVVGGESLVLAPITGEGAAEG